MNIIEKLQKMEELESFLKYRKVEEKRLKKELNSLYDDLKQNITAKVLNLPVLDFDFIIDNIVYRQKQLLENYTAQDNFKKEIKKIESEMLKND